MLSVVVSLLQTAGFIPSAPFFFSLCHYPQLENKGPGPLCLKLLVVLFKITHLFMSAKHHWFR